MKQIICFMKGPQWSSCIFLICLQLICSIEAAADDPARLVVRPDSSTVVSGSRISFFCRADGNPLPSVIWKVNSQPATDTTRFIMKSLPSGLSTLRIEPVHQSDNNTIVSCSADNGVANPVVAEAILTVIPRDDTPHGFPYIDGHPSLKSVEQGRTAHVTCRVHGDPRPKVLWLRDLVPIDIRAEGRYSLSTLGNPGALMIQQAKEEDQGKYECVARNSHGVVHSKAAHLYVKVRRVPPYFSMKLNPTYAVGTGGSVNLTCVAVGFPMPRVFWKKMDDTLDDPATAPIGKNVLSLSNIEQTENFTCVAVSKLGNIETTTTVIVKALPIAPKNFQIISILADSVTFSWIIPNTEEIIKNFVIKYQQKSKPDSSSATSEYASSTSLREKVIESTETSTTISGLEPYQLYEFTIYTVSDIGPGLPSIPKEAQTEEASPTTPPIKVQARSLSRDSLLVQWAPSEKPNGLITGYRVYYTDVDSSIPVDEWKMHETKSDEHMATLYELNVDKKYYIQVQSMNSKGKSPLSSLITVSTIYGLPAQPPNVIAKVLDAKRVQLTWGKPLHSSPVTGYMIRYNDTDAEKEITLTSPYEKHLVTGLEGNTFYAFRVSARSSRGFGEFSENVIVKTKEDAFTGPPTIESVEALSSTVIRVIWLPPQEYEFNVTSYRLSYRMISSDNATFDSSSSFSHEDDDDDDDDHHHYKRKLSLEWQHVIVPAIHTEYDVAHLSTNSIYEIRVAAATTSGYGPESSSLRTQTHEDDGNNESRLDVPSQPLNFDVNLISATAARYTWEAPKDFSGHGYYLYADKLVNGQPENGLLRKKKVIFDKKASHAEVDDLEPNTEYSFRMNAFNFYGDGEFTPSKLKVTSGLPPRQPEILSVDLLNEDPPLRARVDWKRPVLKPLESPIEKFHIWYRAEGSDKKTHVTVNGTKTSVELKGLWMGRVYEITLAAENIEGKSANATEKLGTPTGLPDGEPLHVQYEINEDTMRISWDPPEEEKRNGNISSYKAILTPMDAEGARKEVEVQGLQNSFKVDTRKAYTFKVAALTMKGLGPFSPVLTINPDPSTLVGPPTNVRVEATSNTSVIVQWDFDGGPVDGFVVRYMHEPNQRREDRWISRTVQNSATRHLPISQLTAHKPYAFCVMAIKNNRQGACSDPPTIIKSVTPEYMVTDLEVVWKTSQSVNLRWKYDGPQPVGFYFNHTGRKEYFDQTMTLKTMTTPGYKRELDGDRTEFLLTSLRPYMLYTLHVGVYSPATKRYYWPQEVEVMTDPTAPPYVAPPIIMAGDYKNGLIPVHLQPSTEEYGPISHYWLIVLPGNFTPENVMNLEPIMLQRLTDEKRKALTKQISASPTKKFKREAGWVDEDVIEHKRARRDLPNTAYVTARLKPEDLRGNKPFMIGDEKMYDGFTNFPLEPNNKYRLMMRAFAKEDKNHQLKQRPPMSENPAKLYSDSDLSEIFSTQRGLRGSGKAGGMWLLGPMIALLIIGLLIGMLVCWWLRCNKKSAGRGHRHGSITKVALGGNIMNGGPGETSKLLSSDYGRPIMNPYEQMNSSGCMESSLDLYPMPASHSRMANYGPVPVPVPCLPTNGGVIANHSVAHPIIPITDLASHIERLRLNNNSGFQMEFESIESGQNFTWDHSNMDYNKHKNRYANVVAYDHSRVSLTNAEEVAGGDYINANYIDGYDKPKTYIATQGPLPETFADFWRMVWEEGSATIVMLTNLEERSRVKCDQYWPTRGTSVYGNIHVTLLETMVLAHYTMRTLRIQCSDEPEVREIRLLQYTAWPDHGVPDHPTPFLIFLKRVKTLNPPDAGPIISHCSAGIGRTGAFIAIDIMLERLRYESTVDIFGCVTALRGQRSYMVQTEDQYIFIHDAVLDAVNSGSTEVPAAKLHQHLMQIRSMDGHGVSGIEMEFRHLSTLKWANTRCAVANLPVNRHKNRQISVVPFDSNRIILRAIPGVEGSDYVNASWVDGYRERGAYIATQAPMEQTIFDFWRMIWEHECAIVVMLAGNIELNRGDCIEYWPLENGTQVGNLVVEPLAEYNMPQYVMREFRLSDIQSGLSRTVRHFQFTDWPEQGPPKSAEMFIDFIQQVHRTKAQFGADGPIAVHCISGAGRTGVFVALSILLDRMRLEHVIDVFTTVKLLRTERQSMVRDKEQYEFLYQASLEFLSSYDQYAPS